MKLLVSSGGHVSVRYLIGVGNNLPAKEKKIMFTTCYPYVEKIEKIKKDRKEDNICELRPAIPT